MRTPTPGVKARVKSARPAKRRLDHGRAPHTLPRIRASMTTTNGQADDVRALFERTGALLRGHFVLRSGLHSEFFFQCATVCQDMAAVTQLGTWLRARLAHLEFTTVLAPAMGGLVIGQEVARQCGARYIFAEKENNVLVLRRGFVLRPGERTLVVEDVITRGGRAQESLDIIERAGGTPVGVACLVDRSGGTAPFRVPLVSLLQLAFPTYAADALPSHLAALPAVKPGS